MSEKKNKKNQTETANSKKNQTESAFLDLICSLAGVCG